MSWATNMTSCVMTRLPWFKFYWIDWLSDSKIRRCSLAARGLLVEILCLMADGEERGYLLTAGKPWSNDDVAKATVGPTETIPDLIEELLATNALMRDGRGALTYPDMAHDASVSAARSKAGSGNKSESKDEQNSDNTPTKPEQKGHKVPASPLVLSSSSSSNSGSGSNWESGSNSDPVKPSPAQFGYKFKSAWPGDKSNPPAPTRRRVFEVAHWFSIKITKVRALSLKAGDRIRDLLDDYSAEELRQAITNYAASDWIKGGGQPKTILTFFSDEIISRELKRTNGDAVSVGEAEYEKNRQAELDERARARKKQNDVDRQHAAPGALGKLAAQVLKRKD